jgi:dTDP-4-dehydrorhamnose 3,5-epimerase
MAERLSPSAIHPDYANVLTTQSYAPRTNIEGVKIIELRTFQDDGGAFAEIIRLDDNGRLAAIPDFQVRQSSWSVVQPGAIKAFHIHYNQDDVWFVPPTERLLVGLVDARADSPTLNAQMRLLLGGGVARLLFIPRGVAHGCANVGNTTSQLVYFVNQHFDAAAPDEHRLPFDIVGKDFWEMTPG